MSRMGLSGAAEATTIAGEVTVAPLPGLETFKGKEDPGAGGGSGAGGAGNGLAGVQMGVGNGDGPGLGVGDGEALGWGDGDGVGPPAICVTEPLPHPAAKTPTARMIEKMNGK